jgi:hypothetical protein
MANCIIWKGNVVAFTTERFVVDDFKPGGLHEKQATATGNHLSICFETEENQEKTVSRLPVAGPSGYILTSGERSGKQQNVRAPELHAKETDSILRGGGGRSLVLLMYFREGKALGSEESRELGNGLLLLAGERVVARGFGVYARN